jgi:hypothetical protein
MAAPLQIRSAVPAADPTPVSPGGGPAARSAAQLSRAGALLGALGAGASLFAAFGLAETWRVTADSTAPHVSIVGQRLTYPVVNLAAVVVLALALLGLTATAMLLAGAVRELAGSRRLRLALNAQETRVLGDVLLIADERPRAFCAGLLRPRVYVSTGAVALLDELALGAVLAHERHHARRRDPLRLAAGRVIARALFFVPSLRELVRRQQRLLELSADESAIEAGPESRSALARAMLTFSESSWREDPTGLAPERVDHLLGEPPSWRFPLLLCLLTASALVLVVAVAVLAGQVASGSSTLALPFLSSRPCVVVLATIPAVLGLVALGVRRRVWG